MSSRAKAKRPDRQTQPNGQSGSTMARYPHPQVLLIDVGEAAARALRVEGFNVSTATFGTPYRVIKCDDFTPLVTNAAFPEDFADHDIVVVNLMPPAASNDRGGEKDTSSGEDDWWAPCTKGIVDPRPGSMALVKEYCDRIVVNGGIFVLFASPRVEQSVRWGHVEYRTLVGQDYALDNWGFLSLLGQLDVKYDSGRHVEPVYPQGMLFDIHIPDNF